MNYYIFGLIIIIFVLMYILYRFFNNSGTKLTANANLNNTNITPIKVNDTAIRFAYGVWIYVNSWNTSNKKTIFARGNVDNQTVKLYLDDSTPTLKLDILTATGSIKTIEMTTNFPVQKWCFACFSVDSKYIDCYIDGKLVKSVLLDNVVKTPNSSDNVFIGDNVTNDIYLAGFYHWTNPLTPQEVWSKYINGNGKNAISKLFASYGLGVFMLKDNVEQTSFRIF